MDNNLWWVICPSCGDIADSDLFLKKSEKWGVMDSKETVKEKLSNIECYECDKSIDINNCLILTEEELQENYEELNKKYDYDTKIKEYMDQRKEF